MGGGAEGGISGFDILPPQRVKIGVYIPTGAHIKFTLFGVQYRSKGPENISCVTPFWVITVI